MANYKDFSSPIIRMAYMSIVAGEYLIAAYTNNVPGALIGSFLGMFFGPIGLTIGTALGMAIETVLIK